MKRLIPTFGECQNQQHQTREQQNMHDVSETVRQERIATPQSASSTKAIVNPIDQLSS